MPSRLIVDVTPIAALYPHPNADRLEIAKVKNWHTVVKKGQHEVGERVVFVPPETVVPITVADRWGVTAYCGTLPKTADGQPADAVRVRAVRLRGTPSNGLIVPLEDASWEVGHSVVEHYGLRKYEPPVPVNAGQAIPEPEGFARYTSIENIGNFPDVFADGEEVVVTEKIHGTNCRTALLQTDDGPQFFVGSHGQCVKEFDDRGRRSTYWISLDEPMKTMLRSLAEGGENIIVYSEVFGASIQDMTYGRSDQAYRVFDIRVGHAYLSPDDVDLCLTRFGVPAVPKLYRGPFAMSTMLDLVDGPTTAADAADIKGFSGREGIVIRSATESYDPAIGRKVLKMISVDYLSRKGSRTERH